MPTVSASPLNDSSVRAEINRILSSNPVRPTGTLQVGPLDPNEFAEFSFPISSEQGDLISVPANTKHWFDLGASPKVRAIRIFTDQTGWVPHYTNSRIDQRYRW